MATPSYLPPTIDGRAHWWQNIKDNAAAVLAALNYGPPQIGPILSDANWAVYCYGTIHRFFADVNTALSKYEAVILDSPDGTAMPASVVIPALPAPPASSNILGGVEARRVRWVQEIKKNAAYTPAIGAQLGIDTPSNPFNPATYVCDLFELTSRSPHTVAGKFRKANGNVDGINVRGRKSGTPAWVDLGRYNATPFTAHVPLAGDAPEEWEFQATAVKRDVEIGLPSTVSLVIVRG